MTDASATRQIQTSRRRPSWAVAAVVATAAFTTSAYGQAPTGTPITLGFIGDMSGTVGSRVEPFTAGEIGTEDVNDTGGINGHPLKLIGCDTHGVPAASLTCARKLVDEDGVVALLGGTGANGVAEVSGAKNVISWMTVQNDPADNNNPRSYATALNGIVATTQSIYLASKKFHAKKVAFVTIAGTSFLLAEAKKLATRLGVDVDVIEVPLSVTDFAPIIARIKSSGADVWTILQRPNSLTLCIQAAIDAGLKLPLAMSDIIMSKPALEAIAAAPFPNAIAIEKLEDPAKSKVWANYLADLAKYDPAGKRLIGPTDGSNTNMWFAVYSFADIARKLPEVTRDSFASTVTKLTDFNYDLIAPLDFTKPGPIPNVPRQLNVWAFEAHYADNKTIVATGQPFSSYYDTPIQPYQPD